MLVASDGSINANGDTYRTVGKIAPCGNKVKHQDSLWSRFALLQPTCGWPFESLLPSHHFFALARGEVPLICSGEQKPEAFAGGQAASQSTVHYFDR